MPRTGAILVFDNDRHISELITAILVDEGYVVPTDLDRMLPEADRIVYPPALILLDLTLPARTVATVRDYARRHSPSEAPVVITTTSADVTADRARGGDEYLLKPFAHDDLLACVARHVQLPHRETQRLRSVKP